MSRVHRRAEAVSESDWRMRFLFVIGVCETVLQIGFGGRQSLFQVDIFLSAFSRLGKLILRTIIGIIKFLVG
jgi:hypothetical protein